MECDYDCAVDFGTWSGGGTSPGEMEGTHFKETFKQLEALTRFFVCTKCDKLPKEKVWTLGCCLHKYCEECAEMLSGQSCLACHKKGYPKDAKPDLFFSSVLSEIPAVYLKILRLDEFTSEKSHVEVDREDPVEPEEGGNVDKGEHCPEPILDRFEFNGDEDLAAFFEATPRGPPGPVSQDFPEVMEETPHNKIRSRPSLKCMAQSCNLTVGAARTLAFASQEKAEKPDADDQAKTKTRSQENPFNSDEELFRSPAVVTNKAKEHLLAAASPPDAEGLPVLTPHQKASKQLFENESANKAPEDRTTPFRKSNGRGRVSTDSAAPPKLTPHKPGDCNQTPTTLCKSTKREGKKIAQVQGSSSSKSASKRPTRTSKLRERREEDEEKEEKEAILAKEGKSKVLVNLPPKRKSGSSLERKRRVSSTSSVSSGRDSVNPHHQTSTEKRNAKGETALHVACRAGQLERVVDLLDQGADVNARDNAGWTPIHETINSKSANKEAILRMLCQKGGDVNALGGMADDTPLHTAAQLGLENLVELLLEFNASPNIRNAEGQLAKNMTFNEVIVKMLEEKMLNTTTSTAADPEHANLNNSTFVSTTSMVEEDPAVMKVMLKKAVVYFNYNVEPDVLAATKQVLGLKVSDKLTSNVTHIVHDLTSQKQKSTLLVPLSPEYLFAVAHCMWQLSSEWITKSLKKGSCLIPTSYEIQGHDQEEPNSQDEHMVPSLTRMNRENGNPNLLDGFCFYLYKSCGFSSPHLKLKKKQLTELITGAGGKITNREPDPESLANDIANAPPKFHVINNSRGDDTEYSTEKFTITTHIILFDDDGVPPSTKRYALEHVKTLSSRWVIDSLLHFKLEDPEKYA